MSGAADRYGTNIGRERGRGSFQDSRRFVRNARGALYETRHWLRRAHQRHLLSDDAIKLVKPIIDELGPRLNAYLRSIGSSATTPEEERSREDRGPRTNDKGP